MKPTTAKTAILRTESAALASAISAQVAAVAEFAAAAPGVVAPEPETPPPELSNPAGGGHYVRDPVTGALSLNPAFHAPQPE